MDTRSDNDIVIEHTVKLERLLKESYKATGTGLGTMLTSIAERIPEDLVNEGRKIAAIRNKVVHENVPLKNRHDFIQRCEKLEKKLSRPALVQTENTAEKYNTTVTPTRRFAFNSTRIYWFLLFAAIIIAGIQITNGLLQDVNFSRISFIITNVYPFFLIPAWMFFIYFLFVKNFFRVIMVNLLISMIMNIFLSAIFAPIMLIRLIWNRSLFGTFFVALLLGTSVATFLLYTNNTLFHDQLLNTSSAQIHNTFYRFIDVALFHLIALYKRILSDTLSNILTDVPIPPGTLIYILPAGQVIMGLYLFIFYIISSIHRYFYKRASGHTISALILYLFGIVLLNFSPVFAVPLVLLAFVDFYDLTRKSQLFVLPRDPLRGFIDFITNPKESTSSTNSSKDEQKESPINIFKAEQPRYDFSNVVGRVELKNRLGEIGREIVNSWHLKEPTPNGILLFGPTGVGKTFLAEALTGELGLKIIKVNCGQITSRLTNQTTEQVMAIFRDAEQQAPVTLFMDGIDALLVDRSKASNADSVALSLVNTFLMGIEHLRTYRVIVISATNVFDQLDKAAIREGRFDFKIEVPYPDEESRFAILREHVIKVGLNSDDETLRHLAIRWNGFSIARLHAIVDEAARISTNGSANFNDFMTALRKIQGYKGMQLEGGSTFEQLILSPHVLEILEDIANRMKNIETIERLGGSLPHGILFFGPPGTGKTFAARVLSNSTNWAFIATTGHDLIANPKKIDEIMHEASDLRPCIIFIDEADDVFGHRVMSNNASITNKLLTIMDGVSGHMPDVVFIATTNSLDNFDPAALRGGRFSEKVEFKLPDQEALCSYIQKWVNIARIPIVLDVDIQKVAELLLGYPIATVNEVLQTAINHVISKAADSQSNTRVIISMDDIYEGFYRITGNKKLL